MRRDVIRMPRSTDTVLRMREKYPQVKLHLVLPCSNANQTKNWTAEQVADFNRILGLADSVEYISDSYYNGCILNADCAVIMN